MAPNVQTSWERIAQEYHRFEDELGELLVDDVVNAKFMQLQEVDSAARIMWEKLLFKHDCRDENDDDNLFDKMTCSNPALLEALSSIIILDDATKNQEWLHLFNASLSDVSPKLLQGLWYHAPKEFSARVADFNDNLYYQMQQIRGLDHYDLDDRAGLQNLEEFLQANEYLGSFLSTEYTMPQPPHVDYTYEVLKEHQEDNTLRLGFFPLTKDGMFLQVWQTSTNYDYSNQVEGQVIFIPYGKILVVPASTIHGGGFRTSDMEEAGMYGNLRFHVYVATKDVSLPAHQSNKYTEPGDKTRELSQRYVDSRHMETLLKSLFV
ncbi:hypothetical protein IV203_009272 [Nitzschia inconspicua]|uniref:Uncharacterized protein n=1 Tax=Nitzschia inconspicua TaxID=303405 RepID=A0A9K3L1I4_9STRA|nr:hypothetical protein IV203_009272 [Nitzschia inconspicua]